MKAERDKTHRDQATASAILKAEGEKQAVVLAAGGPPRPRRRLAGEGRDLGVIPGVFQGILNAKDLEGLRLLVTQFPQQQFNATADRRPTGPTASSA